MTTCYEVTFVKCKLQKSPQTFPFLNFNTGYRGRASDLTVPGLGHSVIRGLVTTGQWFSASTTVYPRGSPQGRRHSYFVDCWTFINRLAPSRCRLAAQMYMDSLNIIHCVKICGSRTKPRSGAKHPWRTDFYAIRSIKESCTRNVICHHPPDKTRQFPCGCRHCHIFLFPMPDKFIIPASQPDIPPVCIRYDFRCITILPCT